MASATSTEPMRQPHGPPPYAQDSLYALSLIRAHTSQFLSNTRRSFQHVVDQLGCAAAVLVIDMRLGDDHHLNTTFRLSPMTRSTLGPFQGGSPGPDLNGGAPPPSPGMPSPCPIMTDRRDDGNGPSGNDGGAGGNAIIFSAPPPGAVASFWARFPTGTSPSDPSPTPGTSDGTSEAGDRGLEESATQVTHDGEVSARRR